MLKCSLLENKFGRMHSIRIELLIYLKVSLPLLTIFSYSNGDDKICPHSSQWNLTSRSYRCVDQKTYICLFDLSESNRTNKTVFRGACGHEDVSREGTKYILNPNLEQVSCDAIQYQPFTFATNGNSQCAFGKSLCKSSGQILASKGSSLADASCRCDYTRGFDYIIPPKDPCLCKPAKEDCSCYIRKCNDDKVMIADYRCMKRVETILPEDIKCPIISRIIPPEDTVPVDMKQFKQVSSSSTLSNQASVIIIVIVIIFTVLIGFLFFIVPHVTNILLKSELELSAKRKENEFMILNGHNVKIECNVKSYIHIRSVNWQKEIDGEIIQITAFEDKYKMNYGKSPSLTIDNFNAYDQGKYRCIVTNAIGLTNKTCGSCLNYISRFSWLTGFVKILQHIPAFHSEDMMYIKLHTYDFDSNFNPTVYNVYKGADITMEQYSSKEHKLVAVKWFKESDKWTEMDLIDEQFNGGVPDILSLTIKKTREEDDITMEECCDVQQARNTVKLVKENHKWTELDLIDKQFSGGVPDVPSLTLKTTRVENAGKYFCLLIYDNGETQMALFKLRMIPQVKIYKALLNHREDETYIRPAICDTIVKQMEKNNMVVIAGREGTGKSKICLELASLYEENDYMIMKVDLSENYLIYTDRVDRLLIIDNQHYTQDSLNAFMGHLLPVLTKRNIKVILTCRNSDLEIVRRLPEIKKFKEEVFIDIDSCLTSEEKEEMLRSYMKVNNVTSASSAESNFRSLEIVTDLSVQVTLDEYAIKIIRNEEPWLGFPLGVLLFCSERQFLHLGEKYFTHPPIYLVQELKKLYEAVRKASNCIDKINDYCILVYIMNNKNHQLDLNDPNLCRKLNELYLILFHFKNTPEKPGSNEDQKKAIEEAVHRMNNKYLKFQEGVYEFIHPCLLKAMYMSSEYMVHYLLQYGSLQDITEFVRSEDYYTGFEYELVIKIEENYHHILCERLVRHVFENHSLLQDVARYIYSYWRSSSSNLVNMMFKRIEFTSFKSLGVHTSDVPVLGNESVSENTVISITSEVPVRFSNIIMLVDELTYKGRDPWIYGPGSADFLILGALVSAAMGRYTNNRYKTFKILLEEFQNRTHSKSFVKLWSKPLDMHGNTFFHYLMLFCEMEASYMLNVIEERKCIFNTENDKKYTPIDIAAFLGKRKILEDLNLRANFSKKLRDRLKRLANSGKAVYYKENSKNINIDQPMIHKTKDDSASHCSPEKNKCEDADINDKKKQHDRKDVLSFEIFMINIVDNGKIEDYQSIIKLLSK